MTVVRHVTKWRRHSLVFVAFALDAFKRPIASDPFDGPAVRSFVNTRNDVWAPDCNQCRQERGTVPMSKSQRVRLMSDCEFLVKAIQGVVWEADPKTVRFNFVSEQAADSGLSK